MIADKLIGRVGLLMARSLDLRMMRQNFINANLANVDTPDYKAVDIEFEPHLRRAMESYNELKMTLTHPRHIQGGPPPVQAVMPAIFAEAPPVGGNDYNTVDMDREMAKLAENSILYGATAQLLSGRFQGLNYAINEGGR